MSELLSCWHGRELLLPRVQSAHHFFSRLRGLLGRQTLARDEGLWIRPCHSVHTLGMRFSIAVVFLDRQQQIVELLPAMPPGRLSPLVRNAASVLELHPESCRKLQLGDQLHFLPVNQV